MVVVVGEEILCNSGSINSLQRDVFFRAKSCHTHHTLETRFYVFLSLYMSKNKGICAPRGVVMRSLFVINE